MTGDDLTYQGDELHLFAAASNWRAYWSSHIIDFVRGDVLEVGAGIGSVTRLLDSSAVRSWTALEPDPLLAAQISSHDSPRTSILRVVEGTVGSAQIQDRRFDCILYIDVIEHIESDYSELSDAAELLRPGGKLVALSPAHEFLYSPFDAAIGHYRRYSLSTMRRLTPKRARLVRAQYLDSVGLLASLANRLLLRQDLPSREQISLWDKRMVPVSRRLDSLLGHRLGKSVLCVWEV